jgi:hypothetical protein
VAVDGLKIEPLPADLIGADAWPPRPVERWSALPNGGPEQHENEHQRR